MDKKRVDPLTSEKRYRDSQVIGTSLMNFNRDHIIPHSLLKDFCEKCDAFSSSWYNEAIRAYNESKLSPGGGNGDFFKDKGDSEEEKERNRNVNAFCWMPGNIFLAPCPKADDDGNKFDKTFASALGVTSEDVHLYKNACVAVDAAVHDASYKKIGIAKRCLNEIASKYSRIWLFDHNEWLYDPRNDKSYAKKIEDGQGNIIANSRLGAGGTLRGKKSLMLKKDLY